MTSVVGRAESVAVVGAGASGILTAVQLLRRGTPKVTLLEKDAFGGAAYRTGSEHHLLNVRAAGMSGLVEHPGAFVQWAQEHVAGTTAGDFLPRRLYRWYLADLLRATVAQTSGTSEFERREAEVIDLDAEGAGVRLRGAGAELTADRAVLAMENPPPDALPGSAAVDNHPALINDPWRPGALAGIVGDAAVLIAGCGLTATDVVLELVANGHTGPITMASGRGLLPLSHCDDLCPIVELALPDTPTLSEVMRAVEVALQSARAHGRCWHGVIDGLRSITQELWQGFSTADKDRFVRHVRPWWERRRHRIAPAVSATLTSLVADGAVTNVAGTVTDVRPGGTGLSVRLHGSEGDTVLPFAAVINCTGPASVATRRDGLLPTLLRKGTVRTDPWGLGLDTDGAGAVVDAPGYPSRTVFALGPLRRGMLWECTAIPEIRDQAHALADHLTTSADVAVSA